MPTYEYACTQCGQHVEVFQRLSEAPLTVCGGCGGPLRKVFHPAGIVFKGSGFYATDNRSSKRPSESTSDSAAATSSAEPASSGGRKKAAASGGASS
jgi:putative FmdB family regulatory protein